MNKVSGLCIDLPGDTERVTAVDPRAIKYNETGIIDVEYFNERQADDQFLEVAQRKSDSALFGTHVREAARILRGH